MATASTPKFIAGSVATLRQLLLVAKAMETKGLSLSSVCAEAGLSGTFFAQGLDAAVAHEHEVALHRLCERHAPNEDFLFHSALAAPLGAYSLVELPLVCASTLTEMEEVLERAWREPGTQVESSRTAGTLMIRVHDEAASSARWLLKLGTWVRIFRSMGLSLARLGLPMTPSDASRFADLADEVYANSAFLEFTLPSGAEPTRGNPFLFRASTTWLEDRSPRAIEDRIRAEVRAALQASDPVGIGRIAERMGLSVRTLQRRLGAVGVPYRQLVLDVRCTWATALLHDQGLQIAEIATLIGFSASSSFDRSFRSWSGITPTEWRARHARTERLASEVRDEQQHGLSQLAGQAAIGPLSTWTSARIESDPALAALGQGWLAMRSGALLEAQRQFTDALRLLSGQYRIAATAHASRALGELYLAIDESWSADAYLEFAVAAGSGVSEEEVLWARQQRCLVLVRANRVSQGIRALRELEPPTHPLWSSVFQVRSGVVLVEAGQFESGVALLQTAEDLPVARAAYADLLRVGGVLIRHGRPRLLRRLNRILEPLGEELQPAARAWVSLLAAASTADPTLRMAKLSGLSTSLLNPFERVAAWREGLATAVELDLDATGWRQRVESGVILASNVRTSLKAGEVRSYNATEYARQQLL